MFKIQYLTSRELKYGTKESNDMRQLSQTCFKAPANSASIVTLLIHLLTALPPFAPPATDIHALANPAVGQARIYHSLAE